MTVSRVLLQNKVSDLDKSSFRVDLNRTYRDVREIKIVSAILPNTNPNIEAGFNNVFYFFADAQPRFVALNQGNYSHTQVLDLLTLSLNADLPGRNFLASYSEVSFKVTVTTTATDFYIMSGPASIAPNLGFVVTPTQPSVSQLGSAAIRLNQMKTVAIQFANVTTCTSIPLIAGECHFVLPLYSAAGQLTFLAPSDLAGQSCFFREDSVDLSYLDVRLLRTDKNAPFLLGSDTSLLIELTHAD